MMKLPCVLLLCCSSFVCAQTVTTGGMRVSVIDPSEAVVPGARVVATNASTGQKTPATTGEQGYATLTRLPAGSYALRIEKEGFRTAQLESIEVAVNSSPEIVVRLQVGATTEEVRIEAAPSVQSGASQSVLVSNRLIRELPLNGKNFQQLLQLATGVGGTNTIGSVINPSISGARPSANSYYIDGTGSNDERYNGGASLSGGAASLGDAAPNVVPTASIEEFRVITSNAGSEFGRGSGGQVSIITKSGSNTWHGSAYEYLRNNAFDARDFFNYGPFLDRQGRATAPPFKQNLYGATLGGAIVPGKHFFFANYEGYRQRLQQTTAAVVPNSTLIGLMPGDLGRLFKAYYLDRGVVPRQDPSSGVLALTAAQRTAATDAGFQSTYFDGDLRNGEAATIALSGITSQNIDQNTVFVRTDHALTSRLQASLRYSTARPDRFNYNSATSAAPFLRQLRWQQPSAQIVHTINPQQILEVRAGLLRSSNSNGPRGGVDSSFSNLGIRPDVGIQVNVNGTSLSPLLVASSPYFQEFQTIPQVAAVHLWSRGSSVLRIGGEFRAVNVNFRLNSTAVPAYRFDGFAGSTGILGPGPNATAANAASVQATLFGTGTGLSTSQRGYRSKQHEYFAQWDLRVSRSLTANFGIRYSYFGVYGEVNSGLSNLYAVDGSGQLRPDVHPFQFGRAANRMALLAPGVSLYRPDRNNFVPRLGLAYTFGSEGNTVIRAGYGMFYDRLFQGQFANINANTPLATSSLATGTATSPLPFRLTAAVPVNAAIPTVYVIDPTVRNPYTQRYNVALERLLGRDTSVSVGYVGARAEKLIRGLEPNGSGAVPQPLRPDPRFSDQRLVANASASRYNSLQVTGSRRMRAGLDLNLAYTFARSYDDVSADVTIVGDRYPSLINRGASAQTGFQGGGPLFTNRPRAADWGRSDFDIPHNLTFTYVWELPFGRGRRLVPGATRLLDALVGGFSVSGMIRVRSGDPLNVVLGQDVNDDGDTTRDRPALRSGVDLSSAYGAGSGQKTQYLAPGGSGVFAVPSDVTDPLATTRRNALRGPGLRTYDLGVAKQIAATERLRVTLEANAFNVLNRANFANPVAVLSDSRFGRVIGSRPGTSPRQIQLGLRLAF